MTIAGATQRHFPTDLEKEKIYSQLHPVVKPKGAISAWDGAADDKGKISPAAERARKALVDELTRALEKHLTAKLSRLQWKANVPTLPMTSLEGAGLAAKTVVDEQYGRWVEQAALTATQRGNRQVSPPFRGKPPMQNLFEATDPSDRRLAKQPVNPSDLAGWIAGCDKECRAIALGHGFNLSAAAHSEEDQFLQETIILPFIAKNKNRLYEYDRLGFGMADPVTGAIVISGLVPGWDAGELTAAAEFEDVVRVRKWQVFKTLVHEYIHTLQHPNVPEGTRRNIVVREGFCELLTQRVLLPLLTPATAARRRELAKIIEGDHGRDPLADKRITGYETPADYVDLMARAKAIEAIIGADALHAVFFQGHIELLGFDTNGNFSGDSVKQRQIPLPNGLRTFSDLVGRTHLKREDIIADNRAVSSTLATDPLPYALTLRGLRAHQVVGVQGGAEDAAETWLQIAAQHGVELGGLFDLNPPGTSTEPEPGSIVLVPGTRT
jgi:pimeloyl-ACP methyl ester carboxylesterase